MSMPSSREEVATTQGSRPDFRSSSICARCSLLTDPWCARAITGLPLPSRPVEAPDWAITCAGGANSSAGSPRRSACNSLRCAVNRSASRRELAKTMVERWAVITSRILFSTCGQIEGGRRGASSSSRVEAGGLPGVDALAPRSLMSSTGTTMDRSHDFSAGGATTRTGCGPPRYAATRSAGRTVAESPIRWIGRVGTSPSGVTCSAASASSRSRDTARCAPRLVPARACTSSTITVCTERSRSRAEEVSIKNSDSGVVIKMSGGRVTIERRAAAVVSPERTPTVTFGGVWSSRSAV